MLLKLRYNGSARRTRAGPVQPLPATGCGRPAPGRLGCALPSCARAATSRVFWSRVGLGEKALTAVV